MKIVNIAAYKFVEIPQPSQWLPLMKSHCDELGLKGTVILATEGINLFLAGTRESIDQFLHFLLNDPNFGASFENMELKESFSETQPFRRMVVREAKEIITMRHPMIRPANHRAPAVKAKTLAKWLDQGHDDEGREIVLLDTRNAFEVAIGTFEGAVDFDIERFSQFPDALKASNEEEPMHEKTIVSFCTGGIRCEKAALFMQELGLPKVYQLDGGILRYFEEVGGDHWRGDCFVFDERIALKPDLQAADNYSRQADGSPAMES